MKRNKRENCCMHLPVLGGLTGVEFFSAGAVLGKCEVFGIAGVVGFGVVGVVGFGVAADFGTEAAFVTFGVAVLETGVGLLGVGFALVACLGVLTGGVGVAAILGIGSVFGAGATAFVFPLVLWCAAICCEACNWEWDCVTGVLTVTGADEVEFFSIFDKTRKNTTYFDSSINFMIGVE